LPADPDRRSRVVATQNRMAMAQALLAAGRGTQARPLFEEARRDAESLGHGPTLARAAIQMGILENTAGNDNAAAESYFVAVFEAEASSYDTGAAFAAGELAERLAALNRVDEARQWGGFALAVAQRIRDDNEVAHAEYALAQTEFAAGRYDE